MFFDDQLKGFGIRVMPNRADGQVRKVFLIQYRVDGKLRRETIGDWDSELTTAQARRRAEALRGQVRDRRDPVAERKAAAAARRLAEAEARLAEAADAFTLRKLVQAWESRALSLRREGYRKVATARIRQSLAALIDRPAAKVTRMDAAKALGEVAEERGPSLPIGSWHTPAPATGGRLRRTCSRSIRSPTWPPPAGNGPGTGF